MSYQGVVNIIRGVAQAVNPTGFFEHGRTWDASLNFDEGSPQIYLYPLTNTVDESNNYFETWSIVMGFFFQDAPDSTPAEREDIIANADDLLRSFIATISQVEGIAISGVRAEPKYRQMAGTYSGMLLNFTLGATSNVCDDEATPDIPDVPTFCEKIDVCLGISPTASANQYLNRQGEWTTPAGGGSGSIITKTKSQFLALVNASNLQYPATYAITDIEGFSKLIISTTGANTFDTDCSGLLLCPDYTPSGDNLGQMNWNDIPSVAADEKVIWGDHYWINDTASSVTPTITDEITLSGLTQLSKSAANGYTPIQVVVLVDSDLKISSITEPARLNFWRAFSIIDTIEAGDSYIYSPIALKSGFSNDVTRVRNFYAYTGNDGSLLINTQNQNYVSTNIFNNSGAVYDITLSGAQNVFTGNDAGAAGQFAGVKMVNGCRFTGNIVTGAAVNGKTPGASFVELFDNCEVKDNEFSGDGAVMWDVRTGENSKVNNNTFSGLEFTLSNIDQMQFDEVKDNVFGSAGGGIEMINMLGRSKFNNNSFTQPGIEWSGFELMYGEITGCNITTGTTGWKRVYLTNAKIQNATNIDITDCNFSDINLDLTGFAQNIDKETIEGGIGRFTISHNFSTAPLSSGSSLLFNLIPSGARITSISASGTLTGTGIEIGLENDDEKLIDENVALLPLTWESFSEQATDNRSLKVKADNGDITGGILKVKVEFTI